MSTPNNDKHLFSDTGGQTLNDFAAPIAAKNHFIKVSVGGFAGTGKSTTGSYFVAGAYKDMGCKKPILIIDNEKGSRFFIPFFKEQGIDARLKDTTSLVDVIAALGFLERGEIDFLFVDSLTKIWYQYVRDYKIRNKITFMALNDWGKILPAWQEEFSDRFVNCAGSILFTGRGGYTYDKEEDSVDETGKTKKGQFVKSGVKMKMAGETPFEPDLNIWMELEQNIKGGKLTQWREAQILKDRSGVIDGKTFKNPGYKEFQGVVKYLMAIPVGAVSGASSNENIAPGNDPEYWARRKQKDIAIETIEGILLEAFPGQSASEKRHKLLAVERAYGTKSWTEVTGFGPDKLEAGHAILRIYIKEVQDKEAEELQKQLDASAAKNKAKEEKLVPEVGVKETETFTVEISKAKTSAKLDTINAKVIESLSIGTLTQAQHDSLIGIIKDRRESLVEKKETVAA